jgi:hypothetical protein
MKLISVDTFTDRTTGKPKAWVTYDDGDGNQFTVGPHFAKPRKAAAKPKAKGAARPASAPVASAPTLEEIVAAVTAAMAK